MHGFKLGLACGTLLFVAQALPAQEAAQRPHDAHGGQPIVRAVAVMQSIGKSGVRGTVTFTQKGETVEVTGELMGLEPGKHGFHIHQYGDLSDRKTGKSAGDHFNPAGMPHGRPGDKQRHVGDLGNIEADENGRAKIQIRDTMLQLNGPHSIIGRSVVVHAKADQFTQPSGDAGDRVAVGVIGVAQPTEKPQK